MKGFEIELTRMVWRYFFDRPSRAPDLWAPKHVVVIRWDGKYGDTFVSSFFYRELRKCEGCVITVITTAALAELYQQYFGVDQVLASEPNPGLLDLLRLRRRLADVDTVVHLVGRMSVRDIVFIWLLGPQNVFSLDDELNFVNGKLGASTAGMNFSSKYATVLQHMGIEEIDRSPIIPVPTPQAVASRIDVVFNPFGSRPDKSLGASRAVQALQFIADRMPDMRIGILSSPPTLSQAQCIAQATKRPNVSAIQGVSSIHDAIGFIAAAAAVVTVDTAIVHIACGLRKRTVAIYPSQEREVNPWLPEPSSTTQILFTEALPGSAGKNMDAFEDVELMTAMQKVLVPFSRGAEYADN